MSTGKNSNRIILIINTCKICHITALKFEILSSNKLNDQFDASPAISGNTLFLRGKNYLYAIEEK